MSQKITTVLCFLLINFLAANVLTSANIDMSHNFNEDNKLLDNPIFVGNCTNNEVSCIKVLARYDGFHELIDELNEWKKNVEDDVEDAFWVPLLKKGMAGVGTLALTWFRPMDTLKATTSLAAFCHAENDILKPTGDTIRGFLGSLSSIWSKVTKFFGKKEDRVLNSDKGVVGDLTEFLCGNGKEAGRRITITKEQKEKFMNDILKEFKSKIKKKEYQKNEIMILSLDFKNLNYGLKFDVVGFNPHYDKPVDEYFKPRHFWNEL